jgi:hypothetical protein
VAAWPAVALVGSYELLMMSIRAAQLPGTGVALGGAPECVPGTDPLLVRAAQAFAVELAAGCVPSVRAIRARLHLAATSRGYAHTWPRSAARRRGVSVADYELPLAEMSALHFRIPMHWLGCR